MNNSNRVTNEYPSFEGMRYEDMTPRQQRVAGVLNIEVATHMDGEATITMIRRNGGPKAIKLSLTGKEKFLLNELMLDFLESRRKR